MILELEDIADEAERMAERVEYNPQDVINERLNVMYDLLHNRLEKSRTDRFKGGGGRS
ncbi:MAG: hypothetical protein ACLUDU_10820 [Butyricimonas faecihominis]